LLSDLSHFRFKFFARFLARPSRANLLAQTIALGLRALQVSLALAPVRIESQQLVDFGLVAAAARCQTLANKIRFFANQTNVEHGSQCSTCVPLVSDFNWQAGSLRYLPAGRYFSTWKRLTCSPSRSVSLRWPALIFTSLFLPLGWPSISTGSHWHSSISPSKSWAIPGSSASQVFSIFS